MYKIIEQLCVTTREENGYSHVIAHEKTHTKAYQTQLQKYELNGNVIEI